MKILLTSLNARYIHTSLSLYYLRNFCCSLPHEFVIREYSIKGKILDILGEIYRQQADIIGFSCYIWNIDQTLEICRLLKKLDPKVFVVLGGPEVSYDPEEIMEKTSAIDCIVIGEGEETFFDLIQHQSQGLSLKEIPGLVWRNHDGIIKNLPRYLIRELDSVPFPYTSDDLRRMENKIVYYESSRGCPFNCQYCLSSTIHGVRYFSLDRVKTDIKKLIQAGVKQVKFVDRTFNCHHHRMKALIAFLLEYQDQKINFHLEIAADLLNEETINLMAQAPAGFFQVEIGVQSTNPQILKKIQRTMNFSKVQESVRKLRTETQVHLHLDLIAGLPEEDLQSFIRSFNDVYVLQPHNLQLGFLKLLKGSGLRRRIDDFGFIFEDFPPYEVIKNKVLSFEEMMELKRIKEVLDQYYNSGKYVYTLTYAVAKFKKGPFEFYRNLACYLGLTGEAEKLSPETGAKKLFSFLLDVLSKEDREVIPDLMKLDWLMSERKNRLPLWLEEDQKFMISGLLNYQEIVTRYLPKYRHKTPKEIYKWITVQKFHHYFYFHQGMIQDIKKEDSLLIIDYIPLRDGKKSPVIIPVSKASLSDEIFKKQTHYPKNG